MLDVGAVGYVGGDTEGPPSNLFSEICSLELSRCHIMSNIII